MFDVSTLVSSSGCGFETGPVDVALDPGLRPALASRVRLTDLSAPTSLMNHLLP
jgi:hypothetical protein